jgi:glycosyltransferase involved in cell wall biosynthesis
MRILTLAMGVPFPPIGGGLLRTFHLLRSLAAHHDVTLAAFTFGDAHDSPPFPLTLRPVPWQWSPDYLAMTGAAAEAAHQAYQRLTFDTDEPWFASVIDPAAMNAVLARERGFDVVVLHGTPMAKFLPALPPGVPRVLDLFDVHSVIATRAAREAGTADAAAATREAERTVAFEKTAIRSVDACLAVSESDAAVARALPGAPHVHVVPNGVDASYFTPAAIDPEPGSLLFTGRMNYAPNVDAVRFFVADILPLIRQTMPDVTFHVVGAAPDPRVSALAEPGVVIHGRVDDVRQHQHRAAVVVVPIRAGGGTRLKVLEAAACGKAMVSTSRGIEGLPLRNGEHVVIADEPAAFADAVMRLLRDENARRDLGARARGVATAFDWTTIGESYRRIIEATVTDRA